MAAISVSSARRLPALQASLDPTPLRPSLTGQQKSGWRVYVEGQRQLNSNVFSNSNSITSSSSNNNITKLSSKLSGEVAVSISAARLCPRSGAWAYRP